MRANDNTASVSARLVSLFPPVPDTSTLTVACRRHDYSAGAIARAVEDCDAHLLNLNVTAPVAGAAAEAAFDDIVTVELRVSLRNPASVARSLERYGFSVIDMEGPDSSENLSLARRVSEVLRILES